MGRGSLGDRGTLYPPPLGFPSENPPKVTQVLSLEVAHLRHGEKPYGFSSANEAPP